MCVVCFVCELLYDVVWCVSVFAYSAFVCNVHLQLVRVWSVCDLLCDAVWYVFICVCVWIVCVCFIYRVCVLCVIACVMLYGLCCVFCVCECLLKCVTSATCLCDVV